MENHLAKTNHAHNYKSCCLVEGLSSGENLGLNSSLIMNHTHNQAEKKWLTIHQIWISL